MPLSTAPIITRDSVFDALALARRCFDETEDVTEASRALFYRATEFSSRASASNSRCRQAPR